MKNLLLVFFTMLQFLFVQLLNGQSEDFITGIGYNMEIGIYDNHLYFIENVQPRDLVKYDLSVPNPIREYVASTFAPVGDQDLIINGTDLYYAAWGPRHIYSYDLTIPNPTYEQVFYDPIGSFHIAISGDYMFIGHNCYQDSIIKIDITESDPESEVVLTGLPCISGLAIQGNDLYIAERWENRVVKIDITDSNPTPILVTNVPEPTALTIDGNFLYIGNALENTLERVDITLTNPELEFVAHLCCNTTNLAVSNNIIYITQPGDGKIVKVDLQSLSTQDFDEEKQYTIFPNPSDDYIRIDGILKNQNYKIYNNLGANVLEGILDLSSQIDIRSLNSGIYFIRLENGVSKKVIKN